VQHQHGRVVLEDGGDLDHRHVLRDGEERVGAVALAELGLAGGDLLHDKRVGSAGDDLDVETGGFEETLGLRLIETAMLGLGDPVELDDDFDGLLDDLGFTGELDLSATGKGEAGENGDEQDNEAGLHERGRVSRAP